MFIFLGADHKGFKLKGEIVAYLQNQGYQPQDVGNLSYDENDDYVDFAAEAAKRVAGAEAGGTNESRGVVICGSGAGVNIVANKVKGVRAVLGLSTNQIFDARQDDNINVLVLAADFLDTETALEMVKIFLSTPFAGEERHKRRLEKITRLEMGN